MKVEANHAESINNMNIYTKAQPGGVLKGLKHPP